MLQNKNNQLFFFRKTNGLQKALTLPSPMSAMMKLRDKNLRVLNKNRIIGVPCYRRSVAISALRVVCNPCYRRFDCISFINLYL